MCELYISQKKTPIKLHHQYYYATFAIQYFSVQLSCVGTLIGVGESVDDDLRAVWKMRRKLGAKLVGTSFPHNNNSNGRRGLRKCDVVKDRLGPQLRVFPKANSAIRPPRRWCGHQIVEGKWPSATRPTLWPRCYGDLPPNTKKRGGRSLVAWYAFTQRVRQLESEHTSFSSFSSFSSLSDVLPLCCHRVPRSAFFPRSCFSCVAFFFSGSRFELVHVSLFNNSVRTRLLCL